MKRPFLLLSTLSAIFGIVFLVSANAPAAPSGEAFVMQMLKTSGYRKLPIVVAAMEMVDPENTTVGPRLIDWVRSEQARGKAVLIPSVYYQGKMDVSPSQLVSADVPLANSMLPLGVFKLLPRV